MSTQFQPNIIYLEMIEYIKYMTTRYRERKKKKIICHFFFFGNLLINRNVFFGACCFSYKLWIFENRFFFLIIKECMLWHLIFSFCLSLRYIIVQYEMNKKLFPKKNLSTNKREKKKNSLSSSSTHHSILYHQLLEVSSFIIYIYMDFLCIIFFLLLIHNSIIIVTMYYINWVKFSFCVLLRK